MIDEGTIEVQMWNGSKASCQYEGEINPDGEAHGIGRASKCSYLNAAIEGQFMFGVTHGKRK